MMRFIPALAILFLTEAPTAVHGKCSNADNCDGCLSNSKCTWFNDIDYCEDGCGMDGCGATVCASELETCADCLGGVGTPASGQYFWSPFAGAAGECLESCDDGPADATCYKGKSATDPTNGYDPSICPSISVCRSKSSCTECLQGGACAWSEGSCYDSCSEYNVPQDVACFEGKDYTPAEACHGSSGFVFHMVDTH